MAAAREEPASPQPRDQLARSEALLRTPDPAQAPQGPSVRTPPLAAILGRIERLGKRDDKDRERFRARVDALLCATLDTIEPHLDWALGEVHRAVGKGHASSLDWVQLLDDLWQWERFEMRYLAEDDREEGIRDIRDEWAKHYLNAASPRNSSTATQLETSNHQETTQC